MKIWIVIVAVGLLNYLSRLSFIAFFSNRRMPTLLARALKFVPAAMLTALVVPMVIASPVTATGVVIDARLPAAIIATAVAWSGRGTVATMVAGMASLWILRALGA
jgi:branched-subunit amino acid transport protein